MRLKSTSSVEYRPPVPGAAFRQQYAMEVYHHMRLACWTAVAWLLVCPTCASLTAADDQKSAAAGSGLAATNYVLGPDDEVTITALHVTEITDKPYRIDSAGYITVPMIGRVHAGGLTVELLERE